MLVRNLRNRISVLFAILVVLAMVSGSAPMAAQEATPAATAVGLDGAVNWLVSQQLEDGGFPGFTGESDTGFTIDALVALAAARNANVDTGDAIDRALDFLATGDEALVFAQTGVGQASKLILALAAVGVDAEGFGNVMPLGIIQQGQNDAGMYGTGVYDHAYAILALTVAGEDVPAAAIDVLAATQADNGGWAFDASTDPAMADSNTTAMVIQALVVAGHGDSELVAMGVRYLQSVVSDGGSAYNDVEGAPLDANSTAIVYQAFLATSTEASGLETALLDFQNPTGALFYTADDTTDNAYATVQAIPALAGQPLPIVPAADAATPIAWHDLTAA